MTHRAIALFQHLIIDADSAAPKLVLTSEALKTFTNRFISLDYSTTHKNVLPTPNFWTSLVNTKTVIAWRDDRPYGQQQRQKSWFSVMGEHHPVDVEEGIPAYIQQVHTEAVNEVRSRQAAEDKKVTSGMARISQTSGAYQAIAPPFPATTAKPEIETTPPETPVNGRAETMQDAVPREISDEKDVGPISKPVTGEETTDVMAITEEDPDDLFPYQDTDVSEVPPLPEKSKTVQQAELIRTRDRARVYLADLSEQIRVAEARGQNPVSAKATKKAMQRRLESVIKRLKDEFGIED